MRPISIRYCCSTDLKGFAGGSGEQTKLQEYSVSPLVLYMVYMPKLKD